MPVPAQLACAHMSCIGSWCVTIRRRLEMSRCRALKITKPGPAAAGRLAGGSQPARYVSGRPAAPALPGEGSGTCGGVDVRIRYGP